MTVFVVVGPENEFIAVGRSLEKAVEGLADYECSHPYSFEFRNLVPNSKVWIDHAAPEYAIIEREI